MSDTPDISKLPKWAQTHIKDLKRERDVMLRALNEFQDKQTPSPFYFEDWVCSGEAPGPTPKRCYVQARTMVLVHGGIQLSVRPDDNGQIFLQWNSDGDLMEEIALIPAAYQNARLAAKAHMR